MATNFPTSLDSYSALVDGTDILEAADQNNLRDAVEAVEAKVGIDGSAVTSSHDYKIAELEKGVGVYSGATVFNNNMTAADTFQDLDLSGTVGSNRAMVFLEVQVNGNVNYAVKPKGLGGIYARHDIATGGCSFINFDSANDFAYVWCMTDSNGEVQHGSNSGSENFVVKLLAYFKVN
jgi:hypothetical protein